VSESTANCSRCRRQREFFYYMHDTYKFDVDLAWDLIGPDCRPVEVDEESVRVSVERSIVDPEHLAHVDTQYPGLIAHVQFHDDGAVVQGHLLIDGNHRAARCLQEGKPFYAYVLSEEQSAAIIVRAPYLNPGPAAARSVEPAAVPGA